MSTRENIRLIARTPLGFLIMSTRENIRLIARAPLFKWFWSIAYLGHKG